MEGRENSVSSSLPVERVSSPPPAEKERVSFASVEI
jgi:hypothetical protein